MKRARPWDEDGVDVVSSGESSSSDLEGGNPLNDAKLPPKFTTFQASIRAPSTEEEKLVRKAEIYQQYMKQIPIPRNRDSLVPFGSWVGLGKSLKKMYGQPLHYLTNVILKQWDQERIGSENEYHSLDTLLHPSKAEATIWLIEEIHRKTSSHSHLANVWLLNPMYQAYIDSVIPDTLHPLNLC